MIQFTEGLRLTFSTNDERITAEDNILEDCQLVDSSRV